MSSKSGRSITIIDLYKTWNRLRELESGKIVNIYQVGERTFFFRIRRNKKTIWLVFNPKFGPLVTYNEPPIRNLFQPTEPLRRYLRDKKLKNNSVINNDRVLRLDIEDYVLILEWVREGNIIILDKDSIIRYALFYKKMRDRTIERGETYKPPPKQGDLFEMQNLDFLLERILSSKRTIVATLSILTSIPGPFIYEALYRLGLNPEWKAKKYSIDEILQLIRQIRYIVLESLKKPTGYKVYDKNINEPINILPFFPQHLSQYKIKEVNYSDELTRFLLKKIYNHIEASQKAEKGVEHEVDKAVFRFTSLIEKYQKSINFLKNNVYLVESIINDYNSLREQKVNWEKIEEILKKKYPNISSIDHEKKILHLKVNEEDIEIKLDKSVYKNIEELHNKIKTIKDKLKRAEKIKKEKTKKQEIGRYVKKEKRWYEDFRFFFTSTNKILVIAGKSAGQNELLVRRYLRPNDIFLHADIHGAPATIMRIEKNHPNEREIHEAAQFAASFSNAWKVGLYSVDVYWVYGNQVSKKAPSGEYLGKGSFMIYGKRNYIRGVKLSLAIGVTENDEVVIVPELAAENSLQCYLILQPGRIDRKLAVRKVQRFLKEKCGISVDKDLIEKMLPSGGFYIYREVVNNEKK